MTVFYDLGIENVVYWGCYALGFLTIFVFNAFYGKRYGLKPSLSVAFTVSSYVLIYLWAYILAWVANGFEWGHHNAIRVYIWMPLVLLLTGQFFHVNWRTACDFITLSTCIVYGIARLGCNAPGCCYGIPADWGIFSVEAGHRCFPVQLCEAVTALLIAALMLWLAKRKQYDSAGYLYPVMLVLYGGTRFVWEFFADNEKLFGRISELAIWAFASFVVGVVWLVLRRVGAKRGWFVKAAPAKKKKK